MCRARSGWRKANPSGKPRGKTIPSGEGRSGFREKGNHRVGWRCFGAEKGFWGEGSGLLSGKRRFRSERSRQKRQGIGRKNPQSSGKWGRFGRSFGGRTLGFGGFGAETADGHRRVVTGSLPTQHCKRGKGVFRFSVFGFWFFFFGFFFFGFFFFGVGSFFPYR